MSSTSEPSGTPEDPRPAGGEQPPPPPVPQAPEIPPAPPAPEITPAPQISQAPQNPQVPPTMPAGPSPVGAPPPGYGAPQPGYGAPQPPYGAPPVRKSLSFGAWVWIGIAIGIGAHVIGAFLMLTTLSSIGSVQGPNSVVLSMLILLWPFIAIAVIAGLMMINPRSRGCATGILIVSAALWLIVIGPCIGLISGA